MDKRQKKLAEALENILQILTVAYEPDKIILFGSMANNQVTEWSDLDLVVLKHTTKPFLQRLREVALLCRAPIGVDFFVYTPSEFAKMIADQNQFILEEVLRKGKVLYERQPASAMA
jgi:predicted nucleotidyltransferase